MRRDGDGWLRTAGERESFRGLVLGCIEAKFCKNIEIETTLVECKYDSAENELSKVEFLTTLALLNEL